MTGRRHDVADGDRLIEQGWQSHRAEDYGAAVSSFRAAQRIFEELGETAKAQLAVLSAAASFGDWGRNGESAECYERVLATALAESNDGMVVAASTGLGMCLAAVERYAEAIGHYERGLDVARRVGDRKAVTRLLQLIASCRHRQGAQLRGDGAGQVRYYEEPDPEPSERSAEAFGFFEEGLAEFQRERYAEALPHFQRALATSVVDGDRTTEAMTLNSMGVLHRRTGQAGQALDLLGKALSVATANGDRLNEYSALHNIATVHSYLEEYAVALEYYERTLAVGRALGNGVMESGTLLAMAGVRREMGDLAESVAYLEQALVAAREAGDPEAEGAALASMAETYQQQANGDRAGEAVQLLQKGRDELDGGDPEAAPAALQEALNIFEAVVRNRDAEGAARKAGATGRAVTLVTLGDAYAALGRQSEAAGHYEKALVAQRTAGLDMAATLHVRIGDSRLKQGLYARALESYQEALAERRARGDADGEAVVLNKTAILHFQRGDPDQASNFVNQARAAYHRSGDLVAEATLLNNLGSIHGQRHAYPEATEALLEALRTARKIRDRSLECRVLNNLGAVYQQSGQKPAAKGCFEEALVISREVGDREQEERSRTGIRILKDPMAGLGGPPAGRASLREGLIKLHDNEYRAAATALNGALSAFQADGYTFGIGLALYGLGVAREGLGEYEGAVHALEQALTIFRSLGTPVHENSVDLFALLAFGEDNGTAATLRKLGEVYQHQGEYDKALAVLAEAVEVSQDGGTVSDRCASWNAIGFAELRLGRYQRALDALERSLAASTEAADRSREADACSGLGVVHTSLGQNEKAWELLQQALTIYRELDDISGVASTQTSFGRLYDKQGRYEEALATFDEVIALARRGNDRRAEASALNDRGIVCEHLGRYRDSLALHLQAAGISREVGDAHNSGYTLSNIGFVHCRLGRYQEALPYYTDALAIARRLRERSLEQLVLSNRGDTYRRMGALAEAESDLVAAIGIQETLNAGLADLNKVSLSDTHARSYVRLQQLLVRQGRYEEALEAAERGRARAFVELLMRGAASPAGLLEAPTIGQIKEIVRRHQATVIEYSIVQEEDAVYIWTIDPAGGVQFRRGDVNTLRAARTPGGSPAATVERSVREVVRDLVAGRLGPDYLQLLHQVLIEPIESMLPPDGSVVVVPHGDLFLVPFAALHDAAGTYLIERCTIATVPSIQVLGLTATREPAAAAVPALLVGNPVMPVIPWSDPPRRLSRLPGSEEEAESIAALFGVKALIGAAATKRAVLDRMPGAGVVHLATHGMLADIGRAGVPGAIALTPDDGDDGWLTAGEIMSLRLRAELVVLSACRTGQGRITGDGVIGLSRALITAGASTVVVSLWEVSDTVTAALMKAFYGQLTDGRPMGRALRLAMLETMAEHPHPRDWAAFALIGRAHAALSAR